MRDSNPRPPFRRELAFQASAFNHSANLPNSTVVLEQEQRDGRVRTYEAIPRLQPSRLLPSATQPHLKEEVGFEPTELSFGGFQIRCLQPLGHSSRKTPA